MDRELQDALFIAKKKNKLAGGGKVFSKTGWMRRIRATDERFQSDVTFMLETDKRRGSEIDVELGLELVYK